MYTVEVAPLVRGTFLDSLTFFSKESVAVGALVRIPLRGRSVHALILSIRDARQEKLGLKTLGFALKKLEDTEPQLVLSEAFMSGAMALARYALVPVGAVVREFTFMKLLTETHAPTNTPQRETVPEIQALSAETESRVATYRSLAREAFARNRSVILIASTLSEVAWLSDALARGIEDRVVTLHAGLTARALKLAWERATAPEPPLIIGTPPVLSIPRTDIDAIVVEREHAKSFVSRGSGRLDTRLCAEFIARAASTRLILGDFPLRVETFGRIGVDIEELSRGSGRSESPADVLIYDSRTQKDGQKKSFAPLSDETIARIQSASDRGLQSVVYAARRGIAPLTVCNDCGTPVSDSAGVPLTLYKTPDGNVFRSHKTGALVSAESACTTCGGWNLVTLGIGVDRVHDYLRTHLSGPLFVLTADSAPTHKEGKKITDAFYGARGSCLIGTERIFPYLITPVSLSVVASIDSTLSLSAWRAEEQAHATLFALLSCTTDTLVIETRQPDAPVMKSIASKNPSEYIRGMVQERATFGYPPFTTFITLSWSGTPEIIADIERTVITALQAYETVGPLPPEAIGRGRFRERMVIRLPRTAWPDHRLSTLLEILPVQVEVDADEIV